MEEQTERFQDLGLTPEVLAALEAVGYETPSLIQAQIIPLVLAGRDVIGQAQTGTGKTAAFALPLLSSLDIKRMVPPQVLVLAPTRELAIQVAEAFQKYAARMPGFHVLPIYGGQDYRSQFMPLKRGVHVVVGTPGRVMDHIERGTLDLSQLSALVLDEADEMLRMGFIDDVEWILEKTPPTRQVALFSATMPPEIKRIAQRHLKNPAEVAIKVKTATAATINQRYCLVHGPNKMDALTRILEVEQTEGVIVFVRTKMATVEVADKLAARGYEAAALSGDVPQKMREQTVARLKSGSLDILVATDVAARGLDVERISHIINYDIPTDTETYIHRIGRTGRAGRSGQAILFVTPRERRLLDFIERATRQRVTEMQLPTAATIADVRIARFHQQITDTLNAGGLDAARANVERYLSEHDVDPVDLAAALARMMQGEAPAVVEVPAPRQERSFDRGSDRPPRDFERGRDERPPRRSREDGPPSPGMERYRLEVGMAHGAAPGNIMGAIANEAGLSGRDIGRINLFDDYSTVDLPAGMPDTMFQHLRRVRVAGKPLNLSRADGPPSPPLGDDANAVMTPRKTFKPRSGGPGAPGGKPFKGPPRKGPPGGMSKGPKKPHRKG
jgi:ATP-dependent RNA helicase DeaD